MKYIKLLLSICLMGISSYIYAMPANSPNFYLDEVSFSLTGKKWVKTTSAKVSVTIYATLTNKGLVKMRQDIMNNLNKIAKGDWHIIQFSRSQDNSGLEKLYVVATARVSQSLLSNVNVNAKRVTVPGVRYRVSNIDFSPSLKEVEQVRKKVRALIYRKANREVEILNKVYPSQHYTIYSLTFGAQPRPRRFQQTNRLYKQKAAVMMAEAPAAIAVSNEIRMNAYVTVASNRLGKKG